jgi:hypothetical protein
LDILDLKDLCRTVLAKYNQTVLDLFGEIFIFFGFYGLFLNENLEFLKLLDFKLKTRRNLNFFNEIFFNQNAVLTLHCQLNILVSNPEASWIYYFL